MAASLVSPKIVVAAMMHIRRYEPTDHEAVWQLHNRALDAVGANAGNGPWDDDLHAIETVYIDNRGEFLVGEFEGRIVAMGALMRTDDHQAQIKRMRTHPEFQRRGFGQQILSALERRAMDLRYARLHLDTTRKQVAAQKLYEKNGYVFAGEGQVGRFPCLFYEKVLLRQSGLAVEESKRAGRESSLRQKLI